MLSGLFASLVLLSASWVETDWSDFSDGWNSDNLYVSHRGGGAVEFVSRYDVNNDEWIDVCCSDGYGDSLRIYYGSAAGFSPDRKLSIPVPGGGECAVADLNLDGYPDLVHTGWRSRPTARIYWGSVAGITPFNPLELPVIDAEAVFVADFDRDGWLDLAFSSEDENAYIYWGSESGYLISSRSLIPFGTHVGHNFAGADVDKDGSYELFACRIKYVTSQPVIKFQHNRTWSLNWLEFSHNGFDPHGITLADFDQNGWLDVVYSGHNDITEAWIYFGSDSGFTPARRTIINPGRSYGGSAARDLNGDSLLDLIFFRGSYYSPSEFQPIIYYNTGAEPWFADNVRTVIGRNFFNCSGGMVADFNKDGYEDILANNFGGESSFVYWGPDWQNFTSLPCNSDHHSFARQPGNVYDRSYQEDYISSVFDAGNVTRWQRISWDDTTPFGSSVFIAIRTGNTAEPDSSWSGWLSVRKGDFIPDSMASRYIQYRAVFNYSFPTMLPILKEVTIDYGPGPSVDVGVEAILAPKGIVDSGALVTPAAILRNYGSEPAEFPITMLIGANYIGIETISLGPVTAETVRFSTWVAKPVGIVPVVCFTSLLGDENPRNDTAKTDVFVVERILDHDVGTIEIKAPTGVIRVGDTILPGATIFNFGRYPENLFGVRFRIGNVYDRIDTVRTTIFPGARMEVSFPPWVATLGEFVVSCSTMLQIDEDRGNDKRTSSIRSGQQTLLIDPDQNDQIEVGEIKSYTLYALLSGDSSAPVEITQPFAPSGWQVQLYDSTGANPLSDSDGNGIPDLGLVVPSCTIRFTLRVEAPKGWTGAPASLDTATIIVRGFINANTAIQDSAILRLHLVPNLHIHNFPNPFGDSTTFVIALPVDGKITLTLYNRAGERIRKLLENESYTAGVHSLNWNGKNDRNHIIAPGTYHYLLEYEHNGKRTRIRKKLVKIPG